MNNDSCSFFSVKCVNAMEKPGYVCICSDGMDMTKTTLPRVGQDSSGGLVFKCTGVKCHGSTFPSRLFFSSMFKGDSNLHLHCLIRTLDEHYFEQEARLEEHCLNEQESLQKSKQMQQQQVSSGEDKEDADKEADHENKDLNKDNAVVDSFSQASIDTERFNSQDSHSDKSKKKAEETSTGNAGSQSTDESSEDEDITKDSAGKERKTAKGTQATTETIRTAFMHGFLQLDNTCKDNKNFIVLTLLAALVWFEIGGLKSWEVGFMEVGHTHLDCDQLFAELTKIIGKEAVECLRDLLRAGESIGAKVGVVNEVVDYHSWLKHLRVERLRNNTKKMWYYSLLMKKVGQDAWDGDGVYLYYKNTCDDEQWLPVGGIKIFKAPEAPLPYPHLVVPRRPNLDQLTKHIAKYKEALEIAGHGNQVFIYCTFLPQHNRLIHYLGA